MLLDIFLITAPALSERVILLCCRARGLFILFSLTSRDIKCRECSTVQHIRDILNYNGKGWNGRWRRVKTITTSGMCLLVWFFITADRGCTPEREMNCFNVFLFFFFFSKRHKKNNNNNKYERERKKFDVCFLFSSHRRLSFDMMNLLFLFIKKIWRLNL